MFLRGVSTLMVAAMFVLLSGVSAVPQYVVPVPRHVEKADEVDARLRLAFGLEQGNCAEVTEAEAIYLTLGEDGSLESRRRYANLTISHPEIETADFVTARSWLRTMAEEGDAEAQNNLGEMSLKGQGIKSSCHEAFLWFEKAAGQGLVAAEFNLANLYATGRGVDGDKALAFSWYRKAAESGYPPAQNEMGTAYYEGYGVRQDTAVAIGWYKKAALQGFAAAENNLGVVHSEGKGIAADPAEAATWYRMAAAKGSLPAQNSLGVLYAGGRGVVLDLAEAQGLFRSAAERKYPPAQMNLGMMYVKGMGVEQNNRQGYYWLMLAQAFGQTVPRAILLELQAQMTPTQRSETDAQWQAWFRAHP